MSSPIPSDDYAGALLYPRHSLLSIARSILTVYEDYSMMKLNVAARDGENTAVDSVAIRSSVPALNPSDPTAERRLFEMDWPDAKAVCFFGSNKRRLTQTYLSNRT